MFSDSLELINFCFFQTLLNYLRIIDWTTDKYTEKDSFARPLDLAAMFFCALAQKHKIDEKSGYQLVLKVSVRSKSSGT